MGREGGGLSHLQNVCSETETVILRIMHKNKIRLRSKAKVSYKKNVTVCCG